jgi:hypothetical protein
MIFVVAQPVISQCWRCGRKGLERTPVGSAREREIGAAFAFRRACGETILRGARGTQRHRSNVRPASNGSSFVASRDDRQEVLMVPNELIELRASRIVIGVSAASIGVAMNPRSLVVGLAEEFLQVPRQSIQTEQWDIDAKLEELPLPIQVPSGRLLQRPKHNLSIGTHPDNLIRESGAAGDGSIARNDPSHMCPVPTVPVVPPIVTFWVFDKV